MSLREAVARVLSSDPASNYLGTAATVLDLVCLDVNCLYSVSWLNREYGKTSS